MFFSPPWCFIFLQSTRLLYSRSIFVCILPWNERKLSQGSFAIKSLASRMVLRTPKFAIIYWENELVDFYVNIL